MVITEDMIKRAADRAIREMIQEKLALNEYYAVQRADFLKTVGGLAKQIIENLAVAGYCFIVRGYHPLVKHWINQELYAHADNIINTKIKKNNSYEMRNKAIRFVFEQANAFSSLERLYTDKLDKEQFEYDPKILKELNNFVLQKLNEIIEIMSNPNSENELLQQFCQDIVDEVENNSLYRMAEYDVKH